MLWWGCNPEEKVVGKAEEGKTTHENGGQRRNSPGSFYGHFTIG
jgi:hypothetical protein